MGGVYGDMLAAFSELLDTYEVFKMKPRVGGGYEERYGKRKVKGYWSQRKTGKTGIEGDSRVPNHKVTFWVQDRFIGKKVVIEENDHVEVEGKIFVVVMDDNFTKEGGFYKCLMQVVPTVTDQQVTNINVDKAIRSDYL
jgi:hypothetical protein